MNYEQTKDIKITIEIPFIFRISFVKYAYGLQGSFNIQVLPFSFYIGLYFGLGWSIRLEIYKWCCELRTHLKRVMLIFRVGIDNSSILQWKTRQLIKKLTPEKLKQLKQIFSDLLEEVEKQ